ncbi:hypothetical protein ACHQM5_007798 [Ranunculus cassubicifolius]
MSLDDHSEPDTLDSSPPTLVPESVAPGQRTASRRKPSPAWTQFTPQAEVDENGVVVLKSDGSGKAIMKACCKLCNIKMVYGGNNGTKHLLRHMVGCTDKSFNENGQPVIGRTATGAAYYFCFKQAVARRETLRYFIVEELPFNKIGKGSFKRWVLKSFGPQFKPPCRSTMRSDVLQSFEDQKLLLKDILKKLPGKICFTSDLWTSSQRLGYMCITAHFVTSDWKLHHRIISFPLLPSPHTGQAISDAFYFNLVSWGISDKVGTLTLDNASNNDSAVAQLKNSLFGHHTLSRDLFQVRCNAHVLNLLVKAGLKHVKNSILNIRESVLHVRSSQGKMEKFHDNCRTLGMKEKTLPLDVDTRWDSTYLMLNAAIPYQKVFDLFFCGSEFANIPTHMDWKNAIVIRDFFKIFSASTKLFSGSNYVTSSAFCYQLTKILLHLDLYSKEPCFKPIYEAMKKKFDKYWKQVPLSLALASIMDPRYKISVLELCIDLIYPTQAQSVSSGTPPSSADSPELTESQKKLKVYTTRLNGMYEEYRQKMNGSGPGLAEGSSSLVEDDDIVSKMLSQRKDSSIQAAKSELQQYLDQPVYKVKKDEVFDVLEWWKAEEGNYPILSTLARDLLTIPVSTVPSESAFSASGRVVSKHRCSLKPNLVEALMCLRDWFMAEDGLQDEDPDEIGDMMEGQDL